ncbi:MAG: phosphohistidine phosphatase SixA, partial [Alphaproteobacteria bacterium]|nr:phosphohistidine phosphatase SixA [Alphaproteobacteria bacterium]
MRVYLARHGDAVEALENPRRPLSAKGRAEVERMASFLARGGVRPRRIIHSQKLRAGETAAILARVLAPGIALEESEGL